VKIGPVVSAETRLTNGNCVACSRGSAYFVEYTGPIFEIFSPYESSVCIDDGSVPHFPISHGTLPWQPNHLWTSGITQPKNWRILSNISGCTGLIFTTFSPWKSSFRVDDRSEIFISISWGTLPWQSNYLWTSGTTRPKNWRILSKFPDILDLFSQSFHHMKALYVQMMDLYFFPNLVNFRPRNLGVYAVKSAIFAAMHPQFSYVTLAFRNESSVCIDDVSVPYFPKKYKNVKCWIAAHSTELF